MDASIENLIKLRPIFTLAAMSFLLLWETAQPFYGFFRHRSSERLKHGVRNFVLGLMNSVLIAIGFTALWALTAAFSTERHLGVLHWFSLPAWLHFGLAVLIFDFWMYSWHRLNHRIGFLWRFHRVHHSDTCMDVTSATRFHTGEILLSSILRIPVILAIGMTFTELVVYEMMMILVVQFHHANIALPAFVDRTLRWVIVTPAMHKLHHSRDVREQSSNFTAFLSIWDRLLGTYLIRSDLENVKLGVEDSSETDEMTLSGMMKTPFRPMSDPHGTIRPD